MDRLKGKVAIITGSSTGIGRGIALRFHSEGAKVLITARTEANAKKVAEECGLANGDAVYVVGDVTKEADIDRIFKTCIEQFGKLDILVNNAGHYISKDMEQCTLEDWDLVMNTNIRAAYMCCHRAIPYLKETKGNILLISSMVGVCGQFHSSAYGATKGGLNAMAKGMAIDFGPFGIRANAICPGYITDTVLSADWFKQVQKDPDYKERIIEAHPLRHFGTSDDCALAAVYLCSDEASFVTGVCLPIDGGVTLGY